MTTTQAPVHMAGAVRPFARCGSYNAIERHTRNPAEVTCPACLEKMKAASP